MGYMDLIRPLYAVIFCIVSKNICDIKVSGVRFIIWSFSIYIIFAFTSYYMGEIACSIVLLILIAVMHYAFSLKTFSSIICTLLTMIIMIITNSVSSHVLNYAFSNADFYQNVNSSPEMFLSLLFMNLLFAYLLSKLISVIISRKIKIKYLYATKKSTVVLLLSAVILIFLFIYITSLLGHAQGNPTMIFIYIAFLVFLMILIYFIYNATEKEFELKSNELELRRLEVYTENVEAMYNDIRSIRHDYANIITSMAGYFQDNDLDGLKEYFHKEIAPFAGRTETLNKNLLVLSKLKNPGLKGILSVKLIRAQENNVASVIDIREDIYIKSLDALSLNRIMGILLDNACEAAVECENPFIHVAFIKKEEAITIAVVNSIKDEDINIRAIFKKGFSTKGENRGFGLDNIVCILGKYPNVMIDTEIEDGQFRQILHIEEINEGELC